MDGHVLYLFIIIIIFSFYFILDVAKIGNEYFIMDIGKIGNETCGLFVFGRFSSCYLCPKADFE